jgi:hypothetical protein
VEDRGGRGSSSISFFNQDADRAFYISRETFRKHGIGHIPWELMNKKHRVTTTNDASASDEANVKAK